MPTSKHEKAGLVVVLTGDGKGKTTSALGMALRACGHGMRVAFLQFIKAGAGYGEGVSAKSVPGLELETLGVGFVGIRGDQKSRQEHARAAMRALEIAREKVLGGLYDMVVLDEINVAMSLALIPVNDVLSLIDARPSTLHLVLTGRGAPGEIVDRADLVTDLKAIKHPFSVGEKGRKGIEY